MFHAVWASPCTAFLVANSPYCCLRATVALTIRNALTTKVVTGKSHHTTSSDGAAKLCARTLRSDQAASATQEATTADTASPNTTRCRTARLDGATTTARSVPIAAKAPSIEQRAVMTARAPKSDGAYQRVRIGDTAMTEP